MSNNHYRPMGYIPEVDGLRAIAVLSVLFFHLGIDSVSGGFVGVDIFFVISGFLISQIIVEQVERKNFRFSNFYVRRARRILPVLIFVLVLNLVLSYFFLAPELFKNSADSTIASVLFSSNILFYFQSGYFDTEAYLKPLLHTWSLGVEEQFYLIWPLILFYTYKRFPTFVFIFCFAGFVIISEMVAQSNSDLAFFIIFYRVHEFMFGAALVAMIQHRTVNNNILEIINLSGLSLIIFSVLTFNESELTFPGLNSLIPCLGAAMCIYASPALYTNRLLNNYLVIKVGLISFSLYLIHWPLIVYFKYIFNIEVLNFAEMIGLFGVSIVASLLMHKFIEQPFRLKKDDEKSSHIRFFTGVAFLFVFILIISLSVSINNGWSWRFKSDMAGFIDKHLETDSQRQLAIRAPLCHHNIENQPWSLFIESFAKCNDIKPNSILVFGDSHAADLWLGLHLNLPSRNVIQLTGAACRISNKVKRCKQMFEYVQKLLKENGDLINSVVYSQRGKYLDIKAIEETTTFLSRLKNKTNKVYWFGPQMEYQPSMSTQLSRETNFSEFVKNSSQWQKNELFNLDTQIAQFVSQRDIQYVSKITSFCKDNKCPIVTPEDAIMYVERSHLTIKGAEYLVKTVLQITGLKL